MKDNRISNQYEQNKVYQSLKERAPETLTSEELSEAIRQDIRCVGLVPKGMKIEGMPELTKQEIKDIRFVSDAFFLDGAFASLPLKRRTEAVSQAALIADSYNLKHIPEELKTDELILSMLQKDGMLISYVDENRRTPEMYDTALQNNVDALAFFPEEMITAELATKAIERNGDVLVFVPDSVKTPEMCRLALNNLSGRNELHEIICDVPFSDVCLEQLKKYDVENADPFGAFMLFGHMNERVMTQEMANLAVRLDSECFKMVPDRLMTSEMCMEAIKKDWYDMRFVPENMITKELCEIAMNRSIHAQQLVPERLKTPELYMYSMKVNGMDLEYVPEKFRTPEVCLQAVLSNPDAKEYVPERFIGDYNIYEFYQGKLKNEFLLARQMSFEQVKKAFIGETVHVSGIKFAKNVTLRDFTLDYDRKSHQINMKVIDNKPEKRFENKIEQPKKPRKRKI
jgi:hypothetical protein